MEQIEQLKAMRDAARARIEALPDFRLMTSLSALIDDLEKALGPAHPSADPSADAAETSPMEPGDGAAAPAETTVVASVAVASAATLLAGTMSEPTAAEAEQQTAAEVTFVDPTPAMPDLEPEPEPEPEQEEEQEIASSAPLAAAAEALSDLESLPSEEAIQVLEAVEEALTADMSVQPDEYETDEYDPEELEEEPTSFVTTLGLSESEEEAVNRALAELSVDLDEDLDGEYEDTYEEVEPEPVLRPSLLRR
jgi:hypothetical protein